MINTNKRWLLTASPWMARGHRSAPLAIKNIFLIALLMLSGIAGRAQTPGTPGYLSAPTGGYMLSGGVSGAPALPVITGGTTICVGTTTLLANTMPSGTWSTSNAAVATVNAVSGLVTGVHGGVVTITYTVGISTISTTVTVTYPITGLSAVCVGNTISLTDTTNTGIWSSSNPAVATVSVTGLVTGVSAGTANIIFGRISACTVTKTINVGSNGVADIDSIGTLAVCAGSTITATDATIGGTWSSSTPAVATVVSGTGVISGIAAGASTITYTSGGCFKTKTVIVTTLSAIANILPATPSVCIGSTATLTDATPLGIWKSADISKATINTGGVVTGVASGSVVISYSKGGCARTTTLAVNNNTTGAITGNRSICIGTPSTLSSATLGGTWTSSNTVYATVGSATGVVTGVTAGYAIITYNVGGCIQTATVTVNPSTSVGAIGGTTNACQGASSTLTDAVLGGVWSSSDITKATVNAFGSVTGVAPGSVTISYTRLGCVATSGFTVNALPAAITGTMNVCAGQTRPLSDLTGSGTWTSSNAAVATIDGTGLVTGVASGSVTISYTAAGCRVTTPFTVNGPAPIAGGSIDCIAPFTYLYLSNSTTGGTWSSANTLIATVNASTGAVTGIAQGTVNITYTQTSTGCFAIKTIAVNTAPGTISGDLSVCAGATSLLSDTTSGGVWTSANPTLATVGSSSGIVSGLAAGGALISYTANGCTKTANVIVSPSVNAIAGPGTVCAGFATIQLTDATPGGTWSASNTFIAVNASGKVTGVAVLAGLVTTGVVNYTVGGCTVSTTITVNPNPVGSTSGIPEVCPGRSTTLINTTTGGGTWSSQYTSVATVNATTGLVTGLAHGTSAITFTGSGGCFKTFVMAVNDSAHSITGSSSACPGSVTVLGGETGLSGGWSSSNSAVASIDAGGNVTGIAAGTVTITFARTGGCEAYHNFTVLPAPAAIGGSTAVCIGGAVATVTEATTGGSWSTSDATILTLKNPTGTPDTLLGVLPGTAIVTYTGANGCIATKSVTVNSTVPAAITGGTTVCNQSITQLSNTLAGGTWSSSATAKATVNAASGLVTGVSAGSFNITYTYLGCYVLQSMTDLANTTAPIVGSSAVCISDTTTLTDATSSGTWTSSNTAVATIGTSGLVTGVAAGITNITYASATGCMVYSLAFNVLGSISSNAGVNSVCKGVMTTLSNATPGGSWSSSATGIATVGGTTGIVFGAGAGTANISYTVVGCAATPAVTSFTVLALPAAIGGTVKVCQGGTTSLTETTAGGTWTVSDASLATLSSSTGSPVTVSGVAAGIPYITYTGTNGCFVSTTMPVGITPDVIVGANVCTGALTTFTNTVAGGTWTLFDATLATVDPTLGQVSGANTGVDTVYYTTPGCPAAKYAFTINASPASIGGVYSVCKDSSTTLTDTTSGGVWTSSDITLATIGSSTGIVHGVAGGNPVITFTAPNGCFATQAFYVDPCGHRIGNQPVTTQATVQAYTLFPNPNSGSMHITQAIPVDGTMQVSVLSTVGAKVYSGTIDFAGGNGQLSCSVSPGIYLVLLQDAGGIAQTFKIMVE